MGETGARAHLDGRELGHLELLFLLLVRLANDVHDVGHVCILRVAAVLVRLVVVGSAPARADRRAGRG